MASFHVTLDPPAVATDRVELDLNSGPIRIGASNPDTTPEWGDAAISQWLADQTWGSSPVDYRVPNRIVTIPLFLGAGAFDSEPAAVIAEEAARATLQQKVGLLQREGGWLLRQRDSGPPMYADIVNATVNIPDKWGDVGGIEPDVVLTLECLPDFYGDEITLDSVVATGGCATVSQQAGVQAVIEGDYPARCRIIVTDTSGNDQHGMLWGVRSRHYDAASTAALLIEAEAMTPVNGAATAVLAGASGGSVVQHTSLPAAQWAAILATNLVSGNVPLTHRGSYRVWARVYSASATPQLRLVWGVGSVSSPVTNDFVTLPGSGAFYLVDLGEIRLDAAPVGTHEWFGLVQAQVTNANDPIAIDKFYLQPIDESAGRLAYNPVAPSSSISTTDNAGALADDASIGTLAWLPISGSIAAESASGTGLTHYLKFTGFGFAIPAGATIRGIRVSRAHNASGGGGAVNDAHVQLIKAAAIQATDRSVGAALSASGGIDTYGGSTDLWGGAWTPADINNANFGVAFAVNQQRQVVLSSCQITVYYTIGAFVVAQDAVIYANEIAELRTEGMERTLDGSVYGPISQVLGDLPRLPPSATEGRPAELFVKVSRGELVAVADSALDGFTAQVKYRPCYLSRI